MSLLSSNVPDEYRYAGLDISITPDMMMQTYVLTTVIGGNKYGWVVTEQEIEDRGLSGVCHATCDRCHVMKETKEEGEIPHNWGQISLDYPDESEGESVEIVGDICSYCVDEGKDFIRGRALGSGSLDRTYQGDRPPTTDIGA